MKVLVINGPNLNLLGVREPEIYGNRTYADLEAKIVEDARALGMQVKVKQSNSEGEIVTMIQKTYGKYDGIVINPAAYTHYSIAVLDALKAVGLPAVEVHLSDIESREDFRKISVTKAGCIAQVAGLGFESYREGLKKLKEYLESGI
jgi:3-dehydroquinate dehydratase-2